MTPAADAFLWDGARFAPMDGLPLDDRGARYGMAFFESFAIRRGCVEFLAQHLARLTDAARAHGWAFTPPPLELLQTFLLANYGPGPTFTRLYLSAGPGGPLAPVTHPRFYLFGEPREDAAPLPYRLISSPRPYLPLPGGYKTANYWANLQALSQARAAGGEEALLFDPEGAPVSAAMANLFVLTNDGKLSTPPASTGARCGVIRDWVLHHGAAFDAAERPLTREALASARAMFLTSSWLGIIPVASLDGRPLPEPLWAEPLRTRLLSAHG